MHRSFDPNDLREATQGYEEFVPPSIIDSWVGNTKNYLFVEDGSVGLGTYEYPGLYTVHWFFRHAHRGRKAISLARKMLDALFQQSDAQAVRGLTRANLKGARWASRQVGLKSLGVVDCVTGPCEIFFISKDDFYKEIKNG